MKPSVALEQELIRKVQNGNPGAFAELVEVFSLPLYRVMRRMASDDSEAENLVQEAFWRFWQKREHYQNDRPFFPYIVTVAANLARDRWRREKWLLEDELEEELAEEPEPTLLPEAQLEQSELYQKLAATVASLPKPYRAVIALRYEADYSYEEIAETLRIPVNTVRVHLYRAKRTLRNAMEEENG